MVLTGPGSPEMKPIICHQRTLVPTRLYKKAGIGLQLQNLFTSVAPEPRLGSVLARALDQKARLGSARAIFQKARIEKNWQNEPIDSTHQDKPICTLEYMVWPIRTGRNLPLKLN